MNQSLGKKSAPAALGLLLFLAAACGAYRGAANAPAEPAAAAPAFGPERRIGQSGKNPSTPFLRQGPQGRLYAVWTEDDGRTTAPARQGPAQPHHGENLSPSAMRVALLAWTADGGASWSPPLRVNNGPEAVQGEENGPRIAFGGDGRAYAVWSVPGARGDKMRANVRFAMEDGWGRFTPARTLNEVKDAARFPIVEAAPDGSLLVAWIDRRVDNPAPRQLYLMRLGPEGQTRTHNYQAGEGLCECCRLGIAFAGDGKTVYLASRQQSPEQIRNHALRISTDGGATFGAPIEISDDGWRVPFCPHSGPGLARDARGHLHATWFTLGRTPEKDAGIYYAASKDGGRSFSPRQLIQGNTGAELLHTTLAVGDDGAVYFAWDNLDPSGKSQVFVRSLAPDGKTWGPVEQVSRAKENAARPALAAAGGRLAVAWTEIDGEASWIGFRSAALAR